MSQETRTDHTDTVRRKLLKSSLVAGGFLAAGHIPYAKPAVKSFFGVRSAWAQPSTFMASFTGTLADLGGGQGTGQDAWRLTTQQPNTMLTINVMVTGGSGVPEIGLFAPLVPTTGNNLLLGPPAPGGYSGALPVVVNAASVGAYTLAVEDSQINALQMPFSYKLDVTAGAPIIPGTKITSGGAETLGPTGSS